MSDQKSHPEVNTQKTSSDATDAKPSTLEIVNLDSNFEFKPITEGLGFRDRVGQDAESFSLEADAGLVDLNPSAEEVGDGVVDAQGGVLKLRSKGEAVAPVLFHSGYDGLIKKNKKPSVESVFSVLVDVLFALALSLVAFAFLSDFFALELSQVDIQAYVQNFGIVFLAVFLSYRVFTRVFFGRSIGEWACRNQLGTKKQQRKFYYPIQVLWRELVNTCFAFFLLPLFSLFFSKDLAYYFSGLHTYLEDVS